MKLAIMDSVEADIFADEDGESYEGPTWPLENGIAIILCPSCGEIDEAGEFFEAGTVYSSWGEPDTCSEDDRCNECKCLGFTFVGI